MASLEQLQTALVNADKAGDADAARVFAGEIKRLRSAPSKPVDLGSGGFSKALEETIAEDAFPAGARLIGGAGTALDNAAMRLKQGVVGLTPQDVARVEANRELTSSPLGMAGAVAGNIAMAGGPAAVATKALAPVVTGPVAAGITGAALNTAANPVLPGESEAVNTGLGFAGGVAGDLAARGLSRVVQPVQGRSVPNVAVTPGQAKGGLVNKIEQQMESIPLVGWFLSGARERAVKEANVEAIKKALPSGASATDIKAGREGIERAGELIDHAYNMAYGQIKTVKADQQFSEILQTIPKSEGIDLTPTLTRRFHSIVKDRVLSKLEGDASASAVRDAHNSLGALSRKYRVSADPDQRALGQAFDDAKDALRAMVSRQSAGPFKESLDALDSKYSALLAVKKASGYQGSRDGIFSMEALKRASSKSTKEFKQFANNASDVMGRTVPDSGTAGRTLLPLASYAAGGGAAAGNEYLGGPEWLTAAALVPLLYSRPGVRFMTGGLPGQSATSQAIRSASPAASQAGRVMLQPLLDKQP